MNNLFTKIGKIKFITADILAVVEEIMLDPDVFKFFNQCGLEMWVFLIM